MRYFYNRDPQVIDRYALIDLPEVFVITKHETCAPHMLNNAYITYAQTCIADTVPVVLPKFSTGLGSIDVSLQSTLKILAHNERVHQKISNKDLASLLQTQRQELQRIFSLRHNTKTDRMQHVLEMLGYEANITLVQR